MNKTVKAVMIALAIGFGINSIAHADDRAWIWSPIGIGIAAPAQLPFMSSDVYGLRFGGFLGYNNDVYGLDAGVAELTTGDFAGIQAAVMTWTEGDACGIQAGVLGNVINGKSLLLQAGFVNVNWDDAAGIQFGLVNYDASYAGLQAAGVINWNNAPSYGLQFALVNANQDEFSGFALGGLVNYGQSFRGFQCGLVNATYDVTGYQLGLVNACDTMHGVQIGLINLICESKLPLMVLANAAF